jgi:two-component system NtrC family sensor kinase
MVVTELLDATLNLIKTQYLEVTGFITDFVIHPELNCYPAQLNQVFMNLIVNACDAIREQQERQNTTDLGEIVIACRATPPVSGEPKMIDIVISDNGSGMSDETITKLFEPFFTTKGEKGTGLGLSISFGIVQKHGGELLVDSILGEGTTFTVRLPY